MDRDLFRAIYNYGAAQCGVAMVTDFEALTLGDGTKPAAVCDSADQISFTTASLLMGDSIGIRLTGTVAGSSDFTLKLGSEVIPASAYRTVVSGDTLTIDLYVNANDFATPLNIVIIDSANAVALDLTTSIADYTAYVKSAGNSELALAQLAQACINKLAA